MSIVLGYDESPGARRALGYAVDLAGLLGDTLILVYGAEPPGRMGDELAEHTRPSRNRAGPHSSRQSASPMRPG